MASLVPGRISGIQANVTIKGCRWLLYQAALHDGRSPVHDSLASGGLMLLAWELCMQCCAGSSAKTVPPVQEYERACRCVGSYPTVCRCAEMALWQQLTSWHTGYRSEVPPGIKVLLTLEVKVSERG